MEKNIDDADTNAFRYCGEYYDSESGTIYLRARHYNPNNGRFTQRDSFAGKQGDPLSLNLYTYCHNNPILYWDSSGHSIKSWFKDRVDDWKTGAEIIVDEAKDISKEIKNAVANTFGAGYSEVIEQINYNQDYLPWFSPIKVTAENKTTKTLSSMGDSDKPLSLYCEGVANSPLTNTAGVKINLFGANLSVNFGLSNIGLSGSYTKDNTTYGQSLSISLSELSVHSTGSTTTNISDTTSTTSSTTVSADGRIILLGYLFSQGIDHFDLPSQQVPAY